MLKAIISVFLFTLSAQAALRGVTTTTDLAWIVKEIGGDRVKVESFLEGTEDPHYVDAVPSYIQKAANSDFVCFVGFDLEVGWLPKVLSRSGNAKVQGTGSGHCDAGAGIDPLEKKTGKVDRSMGDVHPAGNPHYWLSPKSFLQASEKILEMLVGLDPAGAAAMIKRHESLKRKMLAHRKKTLQRLAGHIGKPNLLIEYHKEFLYFINDYGLRSFGAIEEKPGVAPSAGRIAQTALKAKKAGVRVVLAAETAPKGILKRFSEISGIPVIQVPASLIPANGIETFYQHQDYIVDALLKVLDGAPT